MANNEASDQIEMAINKAMPTLEDYEEGDILVEWVVIAYTNNPDKEKGGAYPTFYSNGDIPTYRARGLLETALLSLPTFYE